MQAADFCERSLLHYTEPCRIGPSGSNATALPPPPAVFPCTPPDAEAVLTVSGNLTAPTASPPAQGFECGCICDTGAIQRLGTVGIVMRATDGGPNFQALNSECAVALPLQVIDGILQRPCASASRAGVQVRPPAGSAQRGHMRAALCVCVYVCVDARAPRRCRSSARLARSPSAEQ